LFSKKFILWNFCDSLCRMDFDIPICTRSAIDTAGKCKYSEKTRDDDPLSDTLLSSSRYRAGYHLFLLPRYRQMFFYNNRGQSAIMGNIINYSPAIRWTEYIAFFNQNQQCQFKYSALYVRLSVRFIPHTSCTGHLTICGRELFSFRGFFVYRTDCRCTQDTSLNICRKSFRSDK
jgi:hypothetical protein